MIAFLGAHLRAVPDLLKVGWAGIVAYRAEMTIWILTATLPLVMLALWNAVATEGPVAGFDRYEVARYFTATLVVRQLTGAWIVWELNWEIRHGSLSPKLLKPVNPIFQSAVSTLAALPLRVVILAPLIAALVWWRPEIVVLPSAGAFALFVLSVAMAWLLSFLVQATFGMLSFWFDQTLGLFGVWFGLWAVFSGYVAPLGLFPEWAQAILRWLPFRAMLAVPVELLGGFTRAEDAAFDVGMQAVWVAVFFGLAVFVWSHGVRRYGAFGA